MLIRIFESTESDAWSPSDTTSSWITTFLAEPGHAYLCKIPKAFIEDGGNLGDLSALVPFFNDALEMILSSGVKDEEDPFHGFELDWPWHTPHVEVSAELLYGLIHQRFIITHEGLQAMHQMYQAKEFGTCPRTRCTSPSSGKIVPCGSSNDIGVGSVKLHCISCEDFFVPPSPDLPHLDGAFFGKDFQDLFYQNYPDVEEPPPAKGNDPHDSPVAAAALSSSPFRRPRRRRLPPATTDSKIK
ncbi:hypothetical protein RQP46_010889 [Phenoliferia psychrophenolica]